MKVAAIDVGTNSIRTMVADIHKDGTFEIVDQLREMIRLGEGESQEDGLTPRAFADGLRALKQARALCDAHRVDQTVAVATSAVREAANGTRFVGQVRQETGIQLDVISSQEEARLIGVGVQGSFPLGDRRALIIDVGGGSVEFVIADQQSQFFTASAKLGVLRLLNQVAIDDPIRPEQVQRIEAYIDERVQAIADRIRQVGFDTLVATSGTNLTLLSLALERSLASKQAGRNGNPPPRLNGQVIPFAEVLAVCHWLIRTTAAERRQLNRIQAGRIDSIVMGAIFWQHLGPRLGVRELTACEYALRDGILIDYLNKYQPGLAHRENDPDARRRSAIDLAQRSHWDERHSQQVTSLALRLFDQLEPLHRLGKTEREWLEYAALLHDIGHLISAKAHHRHTYYLIRHSELTGFGEDEVRLIAAIARYHRKRRPTRADPELAGLDAGQRKTIAVLAGILRIAAALDRTHHGAVKDVRVDTRDNPLEMIVLARADTRMEIWFAQRKTSLLEQELDRKIRFSLYDSTIIQNPIKEQKPERN